MLTKLNANWKGIAKDDGSGEELGFKDESLLLRRSPAIGTLPKHCDCCFLFCKRNKTADLRVRVKPQLYSFLYLNSCVVCMGTQRLTAVRWVWGVRGWHWCVLSLSTLRFETKFSTTPGTSRLVRPGCQWALSALLLPWQLWAHVARPGSLCGCWGPHSSGCAASMLPTEHLLVIIF